MWWLVCLRESEASNAVSIELGTKRSFYVKTTTLRLRYFARSFHELRCTMTSERWSAFLARQLS